MKLKQGQILLFDGHDRHFSGRNIHAIQKKRGFSDDASRWIHVAGIGKDCELIDPYPPEVRIRSLQKEYIDKGYDIAVLTMKDSTDFRDMARARAFETMLGNAYNILELVWFVLPRWWRKLGSIDFPGEICSEFAAKALKITGELSLLTDKNPDQVFPAEFFNEDIFDIKIYSFKNYGNTENMLTFCPVF
jgi:hypothetical protein